MIVLDGQLYDAKSLELSKTQGEGATLSDSELEACALLLNKKKVCDKGWSGAVLRLGWFGAGAGLNAIGWMEGTWQCATGWGKLVCMVWQG